MRNSLWIVIAAFALSLAGTALAQQQATPPTKVVGVSDWVGNGKPTIGLGERLKVIVDGTANLNPGDYVLFLDGRPIEGLDDTVFDSDTHALVFRLHRTDANAPIWKGLLGAPSGLTVPVTVALGKKSVPGIPPTLTLSGDGKTDTFELAVASMWRFFGAAFSILIVIALVWYGAKRTTLLKDNLLPQICPTQQTYSLGRCQMAFWFVLVFVSFASLFALLWDFHSIISQQALWLMGISGATGIGSVAVDVIKDSRADAANRALQALGLNSYTDVTRVRIEITDRQNQLKANPTPPANVVARLNLEIQDRQLQLRAYENTIKPFLSEGWFRDITTDDNGMSLPRLQTFCWTCALGVVFLIGVYNDLAMPQFDTSLLLLMGISSAGYLGFKYPEPQQ